MYTFVVNVYSLYINLYLRTRIARIYPSGTRTHIVV
jgi:hypothetical protein